MKHWRALLPIALLSVVIALTMDSRSVQGNPATHTNTTRPDFDRAIDTHASTMLTEGRRIFRYETFGSEHFWGDTLQLHKAIAGEKNGGVGPGVSPRTALSVGLKVDADALPDALRKQIGAG